MTLSHVVHSVSVHREAAIKGPGAKIDPPTGGCVNILYPSPPHVTRLQAQYTTWCFAALVVIPDSEIRRFARTAVLRDRERPTEPGPRYQTAGPSCNSEWHELDARLCLDCRYFEREIREFQRCAQRRLIAYCGRDCRKRDWAQHGNACRPSTNIGTVAILTWGTGERIERTVNESLMKLALIVVPREK
jgi:hypothetical protein